VGLVRCTEYAHLLSTATTINEELENATHSLPTTTENIIECYSASSCVNKTQCSGRIACRNGTCVCTDVDWQIAYSRGDRCSVSCLRADLECVNNICSYKVRSVITPIPTTKPTTGSTYTRNIIISVICIIVVIVGVCLAADGSCWFLRGLRSAFKKDSSPEDTLNTNILQEQSAEDNNSHISLELEQTTITSHRHLIVDTPNQRRELYANIPTAPPIPHSPVSYFTNDRARPLRNLDINPPS